MNGVQCDMCRRFEAATHQPPPGWLVLVAHGSEEAQSVLAMITGGRTGGAEVAGTFCSVRCLAEWAYAKVTADGLADPGGWLR